MRLRSADTLVGMARRTGKPSAAPSMAKAMPVLPLVSSSRVLPGVSRPRARASRTILAAARSFTLPPGLVHSALASRVMPGRSRTGRSRRMRGVFPMRSGREEPRRVWVLAVVTEIAARPPTMRDWKCEAPAFSILADWNGPMARKSEAPTFDQMLGTLRAQGFDVRPYDGVAGGVMVSKEGAGAVLVAGKANERRESGGPCLAVTPGILIKGEISRLVDRGYQKFIKTAQYELPATADQLRAIHRFEGELNAVTGAMGLYNEALGTTSDLYQYDRLRGREEPVPAPGEPWELGGGH